MLIIQRPEIEALEPEGNTETFIISPLEPGFGHTLGNSLRRTLLSSIPGAAVTQVRFDEALHEFDVIPGVKEDVTDLILNLKDLVLQCVAEEPVTLRLDKRGPGEITAADIQVTVRCRDPQSRAAPGHGQRQGPARVRPHGRAGSGVRISREDEAGGFADRRHPGRRDLLPRPSRRLRRRADPGRAGDELRPPDPRDRDRRVDQPARCPGFGRPDPRQPGRSRRQPLGRGPEPRAR